MSKRFQPVLVNDPECFQKLPPNVLLSLDGNAESFSGTFINFGVASGNGGSIFEIVTSDTIAGVAGTPNMSGVTGDGTVTDVSGSLTSVTETWTIVCTDNAIEGSEVWSVTGSVSGLQTAATTGVAYTSDDAEISFTINAGDAAFAETDTLTIAVTKPASYIKALSDCRVILEGLCARSQIADFGGIFLRVGDESQFYGQIESEFLTVSLAPVDSPYIAISNIIQILSGQGLSIEILTTDVSTLLFDVRVSSVFPE